MTPYGKRIIVKRLPENEVSKGGIYIPDTAKEKPRKGEVVAINSESSGINVADVVVFGKHSGLDIKEEDQDLVILRLDDVHAISNT